MKNLVSRFVNDESGATAIEYGLIAALISVVLIASLGFAGDNLDALFTAISNELGTAVTTAGGTAATAP